MTFKDGQETEKECPKCQRTTLVMEMSFQDQFSHTTGHYTTDYPLLVCPDDKCGYTEDYTEDGEWEE